MVNKLSQFNELDGIDAAYTAQNGKLRCCAILLSNGRVCLYSPVSGLNAEAKRSLEEIGPVSHLLAPNHYHNKGLAEYVSEYSDACVMASEAASPRLKKITELKVQPIAPLLPLLPVHMSVLYPMGLKTGEIWIRAESSHGVCWLVGDAFCTTKTNIHETVASCPELLGTFPKYGVADKAVYLDWVRQQLAQDKPTTILPCHGEIIYAADLPMKLEKLLGSIP